MRPAEAVGRQASWAGGRGRASSLGGKVDRIGGLAEWISGTVGTEDALTASCTRPSAAYGRGEQRKPTKRKNIAADFV